MYMLQTCFRTLGTDLRAQSVIIGKISASELGRKLIKSALLVGCVLPWRREEGRSEKEEKDVLEKEKGGGRG